MTRRTFRPIEVTVSNVQDDDGNWNHRIQRRFQAHLFFTGLGHVRVSYAGVAPTAEERAKLERDVRRAVNGNRTPKYVADLLVEAVRRVAAKCRSVGPNVLISSIPRVSVEAGDSSIFASNPILAGQCFRYAPADGHDEVQILPTLILPEHNVLIHGISVIPVPDYEGPIIGRGEDA